MRSSRVGVGPAPRIGRAAGRDAAVLAGAADARGARCCDVGAARAGGAPRARRARRRADRASGSPGGACAAGRRGVGCRARGGRARRPAEQLEYRSQARAVRRGESRRCGRHARRGGCGGCESGLGREPLAGRARFVRGPHALGARGVPTAPPVALCRAPCSVLSHCLPAAALRSRGTSGLGGAPRAPRPAARSGLLRARGLRRPSPCKTQCQNGRK